MDKTTKTPLRRVYGRRLGRPLNPARQHALDKLLPTLGVQPDLVSEGAPKINPHTLFEKDVEKTIIEIGFGDGDHLAKLIMRDPDCGYIGAEPYINGMSAFLKQVQDEQIDTRAIRVWMDDAVLLLDQFEDRCADQIYVLNPDPWPKARHHKRRIISQQNLDIFSRIMKPDAELIMTTDVDDLAEWMVTEASNHPDFEWSANTKANWQNPPKDWIPTKYEQKGIKAGRQQTYLIFRKKT